MKLKIFDKSYLSESEKRKIKQERYLLILSGLLLGISFPPLPFSFLIFFGLIPYFLVINNRNKLIDINRATYLMGFVFSLTTLYWVGGFTEGKDIFLMISGILLIFINPIFFLIPSTLFYFAKKIFNEKIAFYLLPFFWLSYEYAYSITDLSFPWLSLSNALPYLNTFIQIADIIGAYGLSLIILFVNVLLFDIIYLKKGINKFSFREIILLILILFPIVYGIIVKNNFKESNKKIKVALIQPNLDPYDKWAVGNLNDILKIYLDLSDQAIKEKPQLIIWPETALPVYLMSGMYSDIIDSIKNLTTTNNIFLLTGMPDYITFPSKEFAPSDAKYNENLNFYYATYNSILLFSPNNYEVQRYGKMKLVPFGERTPFVDQLPFLGNLIKWSVGLSGWNVGKDTINFTLKFKNENNNLSEVSVNGLVCYESIFPNLVSSFSQRNSELIAVVTNDSWYGNTSGPYQHKEISVLRAIENRKYVVRAANGGISCIINPLGKTLTQTKMYTRDFIVGDVSLENQKTFYAQYPLIFPIISVIILISIVIMYIGNQIKIKFNSQ